MPTINWTEIDRLRPGYLPTRDVTFALDNEVKRVAYNFDGKFHGNVELMMLTDLQIGSKQFQRSRFEEYRDWILDTTNRFVFLGGDLIDAATPVSKAHPHDNTSTPIDQVEEATDLLMPLKAAGRLLSYVGGNHERRTILTYGDSGRVIASNLKVPYSRGVQLVDITYGQHKPFKVSLWHGGGNARTKGAKLMMLHRFMGQADSQLYLVGHLHDVVATYDWRQVRSGKTIKLQKIAGVMSSSFQGYWNSYAEVAALSPSDTMMARTVLEPSGKWEVTLR